MAERTCGVEGCDRAHHARGLCQACYRKQYYADNRDRERAQMAAWRERNRDYDRRRFAEYYAQERDRLVAARAVYYREHHERELARAVEYRRTHPGVSDRWRKRNRELWATRNRENQRRRQRRPGADPVDYAAILAEHGMTCHLCGGGIASLDDLHFDHVIPLARGGEHAADNIRPSHALCNLRKGTRIA